MADEIVNNGGWFKFPNRAARVLAKNGNAARVYIYLKSFARSKAGYALFYSKSRTFKVFLEEGQAICSRANIAKETGLTEREVRTSISTLEKSSLLTIKTTNGYSIVSFEKSSVYENDDFKNDQRNANELTNKLTNKSTTKQDDIKTIQNDIESEVADAPTHTAPKKSTRFVRPSVEEVASYCRERNNLVDPQRFVDYYESNGWKIGKNSMKDWKAAIRTWEKKDGFKAQPQIVDANKIQQPSLFDVPQAQSRPQPQAYAPWHEILEKISDYGPERLRDARLNDATKQAIVAIGGWVSLCRASEREMSFKANESAKIVRRGA